MLALNRELFQIDRGLRHGDWGDRTPQRELRDRTVAVVGLGGQALDAFLGVVKSLGDCCVRLVRASGRDPFVLEIDLRRRVERLNGLTYPRVCKMRF